MREKFKPSCDSVARTPVESPTTIRVCWPNRLLAISWASGSVVRNWTVCCKTWRRDCAPSFPIIAVICVNAWTANVKPTPHFPSFAKPYNASSPAWPIDVPNSSNTYHHLRSKRCCSNASICIRLHVSRHRFMDWYIASSPTKYRSPSSWLMNDFKVQLPFGTEENPKSSTLNVAIILSRMPLALSERNFCETRPASNWYNCRSVYLLIICAKSPVYAAPSSFARSRISAITICAEVVQNWF